MNDNFDNSDKNKSRPSKSWREIIKIGSFILSTSSGESRRGKRQENTDCFSSDVGTTTKSVRSDCLWKRGTAISQKERIIPRSNEILRPPECFSSIFFLSRYIVPRFQTEFCNSPGRWLPTGNSNSRNLFSKHFNRWNRTLWFLRHFVQTRIKRFPIRCLQSWSSLVSLRSDTFDRRREEWKLIILSYALLEEEKEENWKRSERRIDLNSWRVTDFQLKLNQGIRGNLIAYVTNVSTWETSNR